jgi:hypothetical protein
MSEPGDCRMTKTEAGATHPFQVNFPEAEVADLRRRVNATKWLEREAVTEHLPNIVERMADTWKANQSALLAYALDEINLAQLYNDIESPAGGKWLDPGEP